MKKINHIKILALLLAMASMLYEYCLSHVMTILYGGLVSQYIITTGLFIFFLGLGALIYDTYLKQHPKFHLYKIELVLSLLGFLCVLAPFIFEQLPSSEYPIGKILSWLLISIIALLSGIELPALMDLSSKRLETLGFDYLGMCLAGVLFSLYFLPSLGLLETSFVIGTLNLLIAHFLYYKQPTKNNSYIFFIFYLIPISLITNLDSLNSYLEGVFIAG